MIFGPEVLLQLVPRGPLPLVGIEIDLVDPETAGSTACLSCSSGPIGIDDYLVVVPLYVRRTL